MLNNVKAFYAPYGMFYYNAPLCYVLVEPLLHLGQHTIPWLFEWHYYVDTFRLISLKSAILLKSDIERVLTIFFISNFFVMIRSEISHT